MLLQQIINGITLGSIYALIALGYTMVYGVLLMLNFAHSEIFMSGAFVGYFVIRLLSRYSLNSIVTIILVFLGTILGSAFLGVAIERAAYRPLRQAPRLSVLITAIGMSIVLQNIVMLFISNQSVPFPEIITPKMVTFLGIEITTLQVFIIATAVILMFLLRYFIQYTLLGKALRAISQDHTTAELMGINVDSLISLTFFIGAGLGGAAGVLNGMYYGSIKYNMGFIPGIKAFTAAVLGGIGNITGAMLGGYVLGICESLGAGFVPGGAEWKDVFTFVILILVLLIKPTGLLGQRTIKHT